METDPDTGAVTLHSRWGETPLSLAAEPALREALRRMTLGPILLENVTRDRAEQAAVEHAFGAFEHLVVRSVAVDADRPLISVVPLAPEARLATAELGAEQVVRLSRFALLRTDGSQYHLESSLSLHRVVFHEPEAVRLIAALGRPVHASLITASPVLPGLPTAELLGYLVATGMVVVAEPAGAGEAAEFAEDVDPAVTFWRPIDLMFHVRTSLGYHDEDFGMTYRLEQGEPVEPVVAPARAAAAIDLFRPRLPELLAADPPFTAVVEADGRHGPADELVPTAREVGELLYRTARVRSLFEETREGHPRVMLSDRPYPASGSCHPLEVYVVVGTCSGIPRGVYHYDPMGHRLERLPAGDAEAGELLTAGRVGAGLSAEPPLLMLITARFRRLTWKYNGLSYALVLKDIGHFVQMILTVCTAMGLPTGMLAGSDIAMSARILATDWRTESSVAGVVLGVRAKAGGRPAAEKSVNDAVWADQAAAILARIPRVR